MFETLILEWDGEFVATRFDARSSTWMFVGVHSTTLGPGFGGTRTRGIPISSAMSAANRPPAPPSATSVNSRGS